ncbi:E3 ubiquitin-protein ligase RSL1-like [Rutidosis leptorrhynchoides]|uniref:E3 ubiquitin-protein ligase RSL1-like n=1 Tax=Rutidosis leptorrhynchoides TaxID=125765 RepID=UPI003A9938D2
MEDQIVPKFEDDEDEFRSCCGNEEELEEIVKLGLKNDDFDCDFDEFSVRMLFKGVSISGDLGVSGIGVIMEGNNDVPVIQIQKKLEFFVDEQVADYLALLDGLSEAIRNNMKRVYAFTSSQILYDQITNKEMHENPLVTALKQRILEHVENLEKFVLKCVVDVNLEHPLHLAQVAVGIVHNCKNNLTTENCLICCEDKLSSMTVTLKCSHKFCSHCIKAYVDEKVGLHEVPVRCLSPKCRYYISTVEHKSFLPVSSYILLEAAVLKSNARVGDNFYCPFSNCSVLLDPSSDVDSTNSCVECPVCKRFICVKCGVRWHSSLSCDEFQKVSIEEIDVSDVAFDCIDENRRWRRCQLCERMIETHGCYHLICWCGHEFCYLCGAEYMNSQQTCRCSLFDVQEEDRNDQFTLTTTTTPSSDPALQFEEWAWDSFGSLSNMMDAYSDQERSQLALIQRFLAGGFSLSDHHTNPCESVSTSSSNADDDEDTSYIDDTIKELHQLPWLEGFVSVISDNYYNEYTQ